MRTITPLPSRRLALAAAIGLAGTAIGARAQRGPIRILVVPGAGTVPEALGRLVAMGMARELGHPAATDVVVALPARHAGERGPLWFGGR